MFDLSVTKLLVLAVLGLVIFGPDQLPTMASRLGQTLRDLHRIADKARADLQEGLGPEFAGLDVSDLHPRTFIRKHLLDSPGEADPPAADCGTQPTAQQRPPFDTDAT